jgi:hypothetical protein
VRGSAGDCGNRTAKLAEANVGYRNADKNYRENDRRPEKQLLDATP